MINLIRESTEVFYTDESIINISNRDIEDLKQKMILSNNDRIRLCTHRAKEDFLHEMLIIHTNKCYVRPHKHINKVESITVLEGLAKIIIFNDDGSVFEELSIGCHDSGRVFYHRMNIEKYHMFVIQSDFFIFHEVTQGPFDKKHTMFPDWSPKEYSQEFINKFA
ncbi:cupin fold metalloprotein, WbuC family [Candidatus Woesearchaeota archaeon]|jgi:cupin fold WbuC family metalloprotein|nr:cupin fold metalloprotein, WbuC family [Candidatus Woesearchaeota archaeon]MBT7555579.1 cupin fold metalloprotein, WbuC family [Candidatus Woesearchaeota archaeon]